MMSTFQARIFLDIRQALGLSQRDLADLLDVRQEQISRWETGARVPRGDMRGELDQIYRDFLDTVALVRAGHPAGDVPWAAMAEWWAERDELHVPEVPLDQVRPSRDVEIVGLVEDDGTWRWTVVDQSGHETDYRTDAHGEGLWVWSGESWRQIRGHLQWQIDPDDPETSIRAVI